MSAAHHRLAPPSWLHLPRRTARLRLSALYGGLFVLSGTALVAATYVLFRRATEYKTPILPKIPHGTALKVLLAPNSLTATLPQLNHVKKLLAQDYRKLAASGNPLTQRKEQLATDQHQLAQAVSQLTLAVHQLAKAGTVEAAQRAADSHQLLVTSGFALVVVTVLALLAGWFVSGRMLRPIRTITRKAQRISSTNLHERLALDGPKDELKELGDTLDDLFGRLDASFEAQRHFVANASHELRTPLTLERTLLQVALDDPNKTTAAWRATAEELLAYSNEQTQLIEALLTLASSENGMNDHNTFDLADIVGATLARIQPEADWLGIRIETTMAPAPMDGDPLLVERLIANLLKNAVQHNVVDGGIEIATSVDAGRSTLFVSNTGPVIPSAEVERLFQPFQRLEPRRAHYESGHGLGLSIVRAIVTAHDATINAQPGPESGLSVTIVFPQSDSEEHL
jgi:signal transduction histidine kinase